MTNSERFRNIFGVYATEIWALPEEEFLQWLNSEEQNVGEWITNLYAYGENRYECNQCHNTALHCYDFCPNCGTNMRG